MMKATGKGLILTLILTAGTLLAQAPPASPDDQPTPAPEPQGVRRMPGRGRPDGGPGPMIAFRGGEGMRMRGAEGMPRGKWWKDSRIVQDIGLSDQQSTQIEKIFQDHRMQLVDLHANLEKAELAMEPMMQADQPNEGQITSQIDKISQARAALEKSNAVMLLGIRKVLTADQWKKLQAAQRERSPFPAMAPGGPGGRGEMQMRRDRGPRARQPGGPPPATAPTPPPGDVTP